LGSYFSDTSENSCMKVHNVAAKSTGEQTRPAACRIDYSTENAKGVILPAIGPETPRSWDELASKSDRTYSALVKKLEAKRTVLEDVKRRARRIEDTFLREATWNG